MELYNYKEITSDIEKNTSVSLNEIYFFENEYIDKNLKKLFKNFFLFCQNSLGEEKEEFNIQPAKFYFKNDLCNNAEASYFPSKGYFLISINSGFFENLYLLFDAEKKVIETNERLSKDFNFLIKKNLIIRNYQ